MATDDNTTRKIPLSKGLLAVVDADDFEWLSRWRWHAVSGRGRPGLWYAARWAKKSEGGPRRYVWMHRVVAGIALGEFTDHIDGDGLNNTRANLRRATMSQNGRGARGWAPRKTSMYRGVSWSRTRNKWCAYATIDGKSVNLGRFESEELAAMAYDRAVNENYGEFATLNFGGTTVGNEQRS